MFRSIKRLLAFALLLLLAGPVAAQYGPGGRLASVLPGSSAGNFGTSANTRRVSGAPYNGFYAVSPPLAGMGGVSAVAGPPIASRQFRRTLTVGSLTGFGGVVATPFVPVGGYYGGFNGRAPTSTNVNVAINGPAVFFGAPSVNPSVLVNPVFGNVAPGQPALSPFGPVSAGGLTIAAQGESSPMSGGLFARVNAGAVADSIIARSAKTGDTLDRVFAGLPSTVPLTPPNATGVAVAVAP